MDVPMEIFQLPFPAAHPTRLVELQFTRTQQGKDHLPFLYLIQCTFLYHNHLQFSVFIDNRRLLFGLKRVQPLKIFPRLPQSVGRTIFRKHGMLLSRSLSGAKLKCACRTSSSGVVGSTSSVWIPRWRTCPKNDKSRLKAKSFLPKWLH